ncbi:MAG: hypothetical protein KC561_19410, partial [Myxococcales bacterium]|nr:hypothetical protein [Myxococcales bacterium]
RDTTASGEQSVATEQAQANLGQSDSTAEEPVRSVWPEPRFEPLIDGVVLTPLESWPRSQSWWFDAVELPTTGESRRIALVTAELDLIDRCYGEEYYIYSEIEDSCNEWLAEYVSATVDGTTDPTTDHLALDMSNQLRLFVVDLDSAGATIAASVHFGTSFDRRSTRFYWDDYDADGRHELLVVSESLGMPECVIGEPDVQHIAIIDGTTLTPQFQGQTASIFLEGPHSMGRLARTAFEPRAGGHPDIIVSHLDFEECAIVGDRPVQGEAHRRDEEPPACIVSERRELWHYDSEGDVWTDAEWIDDAPVVVRTGGCQDG